MADYNHPLDWQINNLHTAMEFNTNGDPVLRVSNYTGGSGSSVSGMPFYLQVAMGKIDGMSFNHKFGAVPALSNNSTGTVWDVDATVYPWDALGAGSNVNIELNDPADVGMSVTVQGLDENYEPAEETILTTGLDTAGTQTFIRVNRAFCDEQNADNIDVEAGVPGGTTVARISAGNAQTLMAVYTVPAGKTGYILHSTMSTQWGADGTGNMFVRYFGQDSFRIGHSFEVSGHGGQYDYTFTTPIPVPEKSDIDMRVATRSNNGRFTAAFDVLLVDNT